MEMMLDKKQIQAIFLLEFKIGHKAQRQFTTSTTHLPQELLISIQYSGGSRSFAKEMRALKMSLVAGHWKLTVINWEPSLKLILLQLYEKLPKNSTLTILWLFRIWSKLERWKSLVSGCLLSWLQIKTVVLKFCLLLLHTTTTTGHFLIGLWHAMKNGFYTTAGDNQLSGWTKKKLQSTSQSWTCTKNRSWSLFGGLLLVWSTTAFWIPVKPLYLRSMLSRSMRCTKNCNSCNWHWLIETAQFLSMTVPNRKSHNHHFKSWTNWVMKFCLICHVLLTSRQLTTTSSSISTTFCR